VVVEAVEQDTTVEVQAVQAVVVVEETTVQEAVDQVQQTQVAVEDLNTETVDQVS
jgi:hypothetical protein